MLAPDVELHVRRPLSRIQNKRVGSSRDDRPRAPRGGPVMTDHPAQALDGPPGPPSHPRPVPQQAVRRRTHHRPADDRGPSSPARQPRVRARPLRLDVGAEAAPSPSRRSRRPSSGSRPTTGSASSCTTTSSTSSSRPRRRRPSARRAAGDRLRDIDARGSTNLGEGWLRGCEQVAEHLGRDGVNRCLLLTDGLANVGITDPDDPDRPRSGAPGPGRHDDHVRGGRRRSTRASSRPSPTRAAVTTTTSPTCRRSATPSPRRWARRSR